MIQSNAYSYRSAKIGSVRLARRAGISPASVAAPISSTILIPAVHGSPGFTPYSCIATYRPSPSADHLCNPEISLHADGKLIVWAMLLQFWKTCSLKNPES